MASAKAQPIWDLLHFYGKRSLIGGVYSLSSWPSVHFQKEELADNLPVDTKSEDSSPTVTPGPSSTDKPHRKKVRRAEEDTTFAVAEDLAELATKAFRVKPLAVREHEYNIYHKAPRPDNVEGLKIVKIEEEAFRSLPKAKRLLHERFQKAHNAVQKAGCSYVLIAASLKQKIEAKVKIDPMELVELFDMAVNGVVTTGWASQMITHRRRELMTPHIQDGDLQELCSNVATQDNEWLFGGDLTNRVAEVRAMNEMAINDPLRGRGRGRGGYRGQGRGGFPMFQRGGRYNYRGPYGKGRAGRPF